MSKEDKNNVVDVIDAELVEKTDAQLEEELQQLEQLEQQKESKKKTGLLSVAKKKISNAKNKMFENRGKLMFVTGAALGAATTAALCSLRNESIDTTHMDIINDDTDNNVIEVVSINENMEGETE